MSIKKFVLKDTILETQKAKNKELERKGCLGGGGRRRPLRRRRPDVVFLRRGRVDESGEYEILPSDKTDRGTVVTMHIAEAENVYLSESKLLSMLEKYCSFMPYDIFFENTKKSEDKKEEISFYKPPKNNGFINDQVWDHIPDDLVKAYGQRITQISRDSGIALDHRNSPACALSTLWISI